MFVYIFVATSVLVAFVIAGPLTEGQPCFIAHDRLDVNSHKFVSQCSELCFCGLASLPELYSLDQSTKHLSYKRQVAEPQEILQLASSYDPAASITSASLVSSDVPSPSASSSRPIPTPDGLCTRRLCRRDEFPFGYAPGDTLPPLCPPGSYCPDEGSGCKPLAPLGGPCQLGRDEQCAPSELSAAVESLCLNLTCAYASGTSNQACISDTTTYTTIAPGGQQSTLIISRDTCMRPTYFCGASRTCEPTRPLAAPCTSDSQCSSDNCSPPGFCAASPETPYHVALWQYAITIICVVGALLSTCVILTLVHRRHRRENYQELREYYLEQISLRHAIITLHSAVSEGSRR